jgi:formylmethanofuran dehydrogenase subunit E
MRYGASTESPDLDIEGAKRFRGHGCRLLVMVVRVAEVALREIKPHSRGEEVVAVVETDDCLSTGQVLT